MCAKIGIVDLFSGPGGLGEGFSKARDLNGRRVFEIDLSIEKDPVAHSTLRLRAFLRKFDKKHPKEYINFLNSDSATEPDWKSLYPEQWLAAEHEALNVTLGAKGTSEIISERIMEIRKRRGDRVILIGGPPCQAYSLAGRGRKPSDLGYVPHEENRHRLYEEYINVLRSLRPAAFIMENVKGMLSSSIEKIKVFDLVTKDLKSGGGAAEYVLFPLSAEPFFDDSAPPQSFVVRSECHGVPQARHRVILAGIRSDLVTASEGIAPPYLPLNNQVATVSDVLKGMPILRSGISTRGGNIDNSDTWRLAVMEAASRITRDPLPLVGNPAKVFSTTLNSICAPNKLKAKNRKGSNGKTKLPESCPPELAEWISDPLITRLVQHETRSHIKQDLERYLFAAAWTLATGASPKALNFPDFLAPNHNNWKSGKFSDRFRVQAWHKPASTVTCHISKDGHYFIHPDPQQCRSITVREAARLQTFPDNYFFKGTRTQQYVQIGNAVPPFLAWQIANSILPMLQKSLGIKVLETTKIKVAA